MGASIVAGCDAPPVLEAIDGPLDDVALFVENGVVGIEDLAVSPWWNDRLAAALLEPVPERRTVIAFVGNDIVGRRHKLEATLGRLVIVGVSGCEQDDAGAALGVGYKMDFGGPTADASTNSMMPGPPFPPAALRWALTIVESISNRSG